MPQEAFARREEDLRGYSSNEEYIADAFKRLDLLIQLKLDRQSNGKANPFDQLKGLVISEDEISGLLSDNICSPESAILLNELQQLEKDITLKEATTDCFLGFTALAHIFHLTSFEKDCLLICFASEIDSKYEKLYAYLQDDVTKKSPTIELITRLLSNSFFERLQSHAVFHPEAPLFKFRLLSFTSQHESPFPSRTLKLDEQIKNLIIGFRFLDSRVAGISKIIPPGMVDEDTIILDEHHNQMRRSATRHFSERGTAGKNLIMFFHGPRGGGKKTLAKAICSDLGLPLIVADLEKVIEGESLQEMIWLLAREAVLHSSALCLDGIDKFDGLSIQHLEALLHSIQAFSKLTFLLAKSYTLPQGTLADHVFVDVKFAIPDEIKRKQLWKWYLEKYCDAGDSQDIEVLAGKFRFTPGQIRDVASAAGNRAHCFSGGNSFHENLHDVCRNISHSNLSLLAGKSDAKRSWDDIILAPEQLAHMKEICDQAKYRKVVYGDWGYGKKLSIGKGLAILFSGPPGSGKTLAAEIIAGELQLHLYKIDLSRVVDKYIGETEKNLNRIFSEAERSNAVFFFDEADALFGKRSDTGKGNVVIGTPGPEDKFLFEVAGRMKVRGDKATGTAGIWFSQQYGFEERGFVGLSDDSHIGFWGNTGAQWGLVMETGTGNVGIGKPSAAEKLEVNGNVKATAFIGDGSKLTGIKGVTGPGVKAASINSPNINVRVSSVDVGAVSITAPSAGYVVVRFDGTCSGTNGDRLVLAASKTSKTWGVNDGNVSVLFSSTSGLEACFSHTRVYAVAAGPSAYFAVAQNYVNTAGTGVVSIYGTLTVEFFPNGL